MMFSLNKFLAALTLFLALFTGFAAALPHSKQQERRDVVYGPNSVYYCVGGGFSPSETNNGVNCAQQTYTPGHCQTVLSHFGGQISSFIPLNPGAVCALHQSINCSDDILDQVWIGGGGLAGNGEKRNFGDAQNSYICQ